MRSLSFLLLSIAACVPAVAAQDLTLNPRYSYSHSPFQSGFTPITPTYNEPLISNPIMVSPNPNPLLVGSSPALIPLQQQTPVSLDLPMQQQQQQQISADSESEFNVQDVPRSAHMFERERELKREERLERESKERDAPLGLYVSTEGPLRVFRIRGTPGQPLEFSYTLLEKPSLSHKQLMKQLKDLGKIKGLKEVAIEREIKFKFEKEKMKEKKEKDHEKREKREEEHFEKEEEELEELERLLKEKKGLKEKKKYHEGEKKDHEKIEEEHFKRAEEELEELKRLVKEKKGLKEKKYHKKKGEKKHYKSLKYPHVKEEEEEEEEEEREEMKERRKHGREHKKVKGIKKFTPLKYQVGAPIKLVPGVELPEYEEKHELEEEKELKPEREEEMKKFVRSKRLLRSGAGKMKRLRVVMINPEELEYLRELEREKEMEREREREMEEREEEEEEYPYLRTRRGSRRERRYPRHPIRSRRSYE